MMDLDDVLTVGSWVHGIDELAKSKVWADDENAQLWMTQMEKLEGEPQNFCQECDGCAYTLIYHECEKKNSIM